MVAHELLVFYTPNTLAKFQQSPQREYWIQVM